MLIAITRQVSPSINRCELTFHAQEPIDLAKAIAQHEAYEDCLRGLGVRVVSLTAEPDLPDAVFVEDAAIVVDEIAVIPIMGAASRRPETESLALALSVYRPLKLMRAPATLDGGDVMRIGRRIFVGASSRTNAEGIAQLRAALSPFDYEVTAVDVRQCLHLKSGCSYVGRNSILVNRELVDVTRLAGFELIDVLASEPGAANVLLIEGVIDDAKEGVIPGPGETSVKDVLIVPSAFPQTISLLEARGYNVRAIDVSEFQKAEGGVTCKSIIFNSDDPESWQPWRRALKGTPTREAGDGVKPRVSPRTRGQCRTEWRTHEVGGGSHGFQRDSREKRRPPPSSRVQSPSSHLTTGSRTHRWLYSAIPLRGSNAKA